MIFFKYAREYKLFGEGGVDFGYIVHTTRTDVKLAPFNSVISLCVLEGSKWRYFNTEIDLFSENCDENILIQYFPDNTVQNFLDRAKHPNGEMDDNSEILLDFLKSFDS